jgi:hypothetical protein
MSKTKLSKSKGKQLLEETKQRLRLQQEARTIARIEQLNKEACERLGRQLQLTQSQVEHLELNGELECSATNTARQFTLHLSDSEEDLTTEENHSSTVETVNVVRSSSILETPD